MDKLKILITGGSGYIAQAIYQKYKHIYDITLLTRKDVDLLDFKSTRNWFKSRFFDCVVHTAITGGNRFLPENSDTLDYNLTLYYNLLSNRSCYNKFINFGSGAELHATHTPYGMSKFIIAESMKDKLHFYNIRIFAVFDERESERRFIKSNILNYVNKRPLIIHQNKLMDFFYMEDLVTLVKYYVEEVKPPKVIDCTYSSSLTLQDIALQINNLESYKCDIQLLDPSSMAAPYTGTYTPILNYNGLVNGIKNVYKVLSVQSSNLL